MSTSAPVLLAIDTPVRFAAAVETAVARLRAGELVALPTETVYGLAANALNPEAVQRVFEAKGRPTHNPIIVHVASLALARSCASDWPEIATRLATAFWPGPLTLVLPRARCIPDVVTAGGSSVGLRWPNHPFIQAVIQACGFPLAAPSANVAGQLSPTRAEHVRKGLGHRVGLIIDGGPAPVGIESTVLDLTTRPPVILRPGTIHPESLLAVTGALGPTARHAGRPLKSPGQLLKHYAPKARLLVCSWRKEEALERQVRRAGASLGECHVLAHQVVPRGPGWGGITVMPHDAAAYASAVYAELHRCDDAGAAWIVVEAPPAVPAWQGISDRLRRAAA